MDIFWQLKNEINTWFITIKQKSWNSVYESSNNAERIPLQETFPNSGIKGDSVLRIQLHNTANGCQNLNIGLSWPG